MTAEKRAPRARPARDARPALAGGLAERLSPEDLADRYNVPLPTIYGWNSKGTGPRFMKLGKHVRYKIEDVLAWENEQYADQAAS